MTLHDLVKGLTKQFPTAMESLYRYSLDNASELDGLCKAILGQHPQMVEPVGLLQSEGAKPRLTKECKQALHEALRLELPRTAARRR